MKLSDHQIRMVEAVYNGVKTAENPEKVFIGHINSWIKNAGLNGRGRNWMDPYRTNDTGRFKYQVFYNFGWMADATLDEVLGKIDSAAVIRTDTTLPKPERKTEVRVVAEPAKETKASAKVMPGSLGSDQPLGFYIPTKDNAFVAFGPMRDLNTIVSSRVFLPTYIYGDTGIAKSMSVVQACARNKRELFRVNVNINTDEEDFIGGFRLVDGETVFQKGPLVLAMERGAILLIDEISALSPSNAFCLFSVLEGNELYIKKTNEKIRPADGFNIIVTDNTKGKGSTTGRFVGTNVQNDALLDRFVVALEYVYPTAAQELRILNAVDNRNEELNRNLIKWANIVRTSFADGLVDENISVRKLVSILNINRVFDNIKTSINLALNRYEADTKESILSLFDKVVVDPTYGDLNFDDPESSVTVSVDDDETGVPDSI